MTKEKISRSKARGIRRDWLRKAIFEWLYMPDVEQLERMLAILMAAMCITNEGNKQKCNGDLVDRMIETLRENR